MHDCSYTCILTLGRERTESDARVRVSNLRWRLGRGRREKERRGEKDYDGERQKENGEGTESEREKESLPCPLLCWPGYQWRRLHALQTHTSRALSCQEMTAKITNHNTPQLLVHWNWKNVMTQRMLRSKVCLTVKPRKILMQRHSQVSSQSAAGFTGTFTEWKQCHFTTLDTKNTLTQNINH